MIIDCISDLHGHYPKLDGGDLLIVAGDLTASDSEEEYWIFHQWIEKLNYSKKIVIAGNHDNLIQKDKDIMQPFGKMFDYLCDSGTEVPYYPILDPPNLKNLNGIPYKRKMLKIWGSPWTQKFQGMNPSCMAFTKDTEKDLAEKWALIPPDTDILVTHSPSWGNYDITVTGDSVGSQTLWMMCLFVKLRLHVFGHVHESYGNSVHNNGIHLVNASHVNEKYQPVNKPIRIIL